MITAKDNEQLKKIRKLYKKSSHRRDEGCFVTEGFKMVCEALDRDIVSDIYISDAKIDAINDDIKKSDVHIEIVRDDIFGGLTDTITPQGILAVVHTPEYDITSIYKRDDVHLLVLEDIQDPGNMGTMIRTAEAAGYDALILSKGCVDPYNPKVVKATMGAIFREPVVICEKDITTEVEKYRTDGFSIYAAELDGAVEYKDISYSSRMALLIGNEGRGLSDGMKALSDVRVRIPMKGQVESLNAAISAAILMYESI